MPNGDVPPGRTAHLFATAGGRTRCLRCGQSRVTRWRSKLGVLCQLRRLWPGRGECVATSMRHSHLTSSLSPTVGCSAGAQAAAAAADLEKDPASHGAQEREHQTGHLQWISRLPSPGLSTAQ